MAFALPPPLARRARRQAARRTALANSPLANSTPSDVRKAQPIVRAASSTLPGLDSEQNSVLSTVLNRGVRLPDTSYRDLLSGTETGLVESNLRNLGYGDADSKGWRQERTSIYGDGPTGPNDVKASADRFWQELRDQGAGAPTPGQAAQAAQGSAFPDRYDQEEGTARPLVNAYLKRREARGLLGMSNAVKGPAAQQGGGGIQPAKRPASVAELFYDPGVSLKDGNQIGSIGGHSDHVHVASNDPVAEKRFLKIAERRGLHVGENLFVGETPEPGIHVPDSYHYRDAKLPNGKPISLGADISGTPEQMAAYDQLIAQKFGDNPQATAGDYSSGGIGGGSDLALGGMGGASGASAGTPAQQPQAQVAISPLSAPAAAGPALPDAYQAPAAGGVSGQQEAGLDELLAMLGGQPTAGVPRRRRPGLLGAGR